MGSSQANYPTDFGREVHGWIDICALDDIEDKRGRAVVIRGNDVAIMRDGDSVHALGGVCPHRGGPIAEGHVIDGSAICPMHLWDFDLLTGVSAFNPNDCLPHYEARVRDGRVEVDADTVPLGPGRPDVYLGPWIRRGATDRGMYVVHHLADGGRPEVAAMGSQRIDAAVDHESRFPSLDDLVFVPAQLARLPLFDDEAVDTSVRLGTRAARPLELDIPIVVSHMSYGALSPEAKVALATGAREVGTAICSGEGGMLPAERQAAGRYVLEMASGYFGWTEESIAQADAVEIKIGQGAKPAMGGVLPGAKVTPEIATVRGIEPGEDSHSPSRFPDINTTEDLARRVEWIKTVNVGIPVGIKIASGRVTDDIAVAVEAGADYLILDGFGGGTGAAPVHVRDHVGSPSWFGLRGARDWLDSHGYDDVQIVVTGGIRTPDEMAKVLALGADAVALATAAMMAIGCQQYRACHRGTCPIGITTQDPVLRARLDPQLSAKRLERFLETSTSMIADYCRIMGHSAVSDLNPDDLSALNPATAALLDVPLTR
ncbi:MAG: nitrite reductase (NAD(P)H) small subunit [Microthrixaceae bacterium]|nr:nitrite reductase (NAD(P)H) small subunit [Microthrixaceae bacterium]